MSMRVLMMHKNDVKTEAGQPPTPEVMAKMGAFIGEHMQAGRFIDGAGLTGSKDRTRLVFRDGRSTVKHGPYRGERELPAAMMQLAVGTRDEAIGWAERYGKILGDGEIELGKITEPWDLGMMPMPENPPLQLLLIEKEGAALSAKQKADLTRLGTEMTKAGVLVKSFRLEPSAKGKRLRFTNNELGVIDGPFAESKELLGGFSIMELGGFDDAIEVARPYAAILGGDLEIDLRVVEAG